MSEPVLITLMICLTVIFLGLIVAIVIRWVCIVMMSRPKQIDIPIDAFVTTEEFEEYEAMMSDILHKLEDKIDEHNK